MYISVFTSNYAQETKRVVELLELSNLQKEILYKRYTREVLVHAWWNKFMTTMYMICLVTITISSAVVPAVLTIQDNVTDPALKPILFWFVWVSALSITILNGIVQLFSLDRKVILNAYITDKLIAEGWLYYQMSGNYKDHENHEAAFMVFCENVEHILIKSSSQNIDSKKSNGGGSIVFSDRHKLKNTYQSDRVNSPVISPVISTLSVELDTIESPQISIDIAPEVASV
jgi:hypothetical protein